MMVAVPCLAHPIPDVPVRASFTQGNALILQVEIDPRCFEPDPNVALSVTNADLATPTYTSVKKEQLKTLAAEYIQKVVEITLEPTGPLRPVFDWQFTTHNDVPLKAPEDVVVLTGTWRTTLPGDTTGYSVSALPAGSLSILPENTAHGKKIERLQILFPGETSYVLDLKTYTPRTPPPPVISATGPMGTVEDPSVCVTCYGVTSEQTLPVVLASVAIIIAMTWWKRTRARAPNS